MDPKTVSSFSFAATICRELLRIITMSGIASSVCDSIGTVAMTAPLRRISAWVSLPAGAKFVVTAGTDAMGGVC